MSVYEAIDRVKYAYFFKGKEGVYTEIKSLYAEIKPIRNKGISIGMNKKDCFFCSICWSCLWTRIKGKKNLLLRKIRVNGLVMRMASVLKQNKYREK